MQQINRRPNVFSDSQIDQIRDGAADILEQIGVKLMRPELVEQLSKKGFSTDGSFVRFERKMVLDKIASQRPASDAPLGPLEPLRPYHTYPSAYSNTYELIGGEYVPIDSDNNAQMAQYVTNAAALYPGLRPVCPGHPTDVHPDLQFLMQAVNGFLYCPDFHSMEPVSVKTAPYQFEICEMMGRPFTGLPVYVASPLTIAGESFDIVLANAHKLKDAWVGSMPSIGANTPLNLTAAYAQTVAETVGGALVVEALAGIPTSFGTNLFTFDFYAMSMPFGTPEKLLLEWTNLEVASRISGWDNPYVYSTDIHTNALRCGAQACIEKASLIMAGAMYGSQVFHTSGTLGMDELFSPVQLLLDMEILGHVQRIIDGMPNDAFEGDLIEEVRAGLQGGYISSDRTLDNMHEYVWPSRLLNRHSFGAHLSDPVKVEVEKARDLASDIMKRPPAYYAGEEVEREARAIFARALAAMEA